MNSFLTWIGSLLILALAALFIGPHYVDWNGYRGVFEEEASRILGRDVRVGGDVNLRLLPAPYVRFEQLQIADTTGIAGAPLFSAESFTMWLSVPPLLKGVLEAKRIELERPSVSLAIDENGHGNWRSLSAGYGSLPFVPAGVELQSVHITDGTVRMSLQGGGEVARLDKINGELTAKKLAGPYTFRGAVEMNGAKREVRLATTEPDDTKAMRLNGQIVLPSNNDRYTVDLKVSNLWERPAVEGDLTGRVAVGNLGGDAVAELKAKLKAHARSAELSEIVATLENAGQPQILEGALLAEWGAKQKLRLSLNSRWLDLDRLARKGPDGATPAEPTEGAAKPAVSDPLQAAPKLLTGFVGLFPDKTDVEADLKVDQVNLGGEAVSDVSLRLKHAGGPFEVTALHANLPGGARFDFSGQVEDHATKPVFTGDLYVGGASTARVIGWAMGPGSAPEISTDGPFAVDSAVRLSASSLQLNNAKAEFSGVPIRGSLNWRHEGDGKRLEASIEGSEFDTRWIGVNIFAMPAVVDVLSAGDNAEAENGALPGWLAGRYGDVQLKVRADTLRNGEKELKDVEADIGLRNGRIEVAKADFKTEAGLSVSLEGAIDEPSKAPRGALRFVIAAKDRQAVDALAGALGGEASRGLFPERLADLAPFRLAGKLSLSERLPEAADIDIDGMASGGSVTARLRLDGGIDGWRDHPADIQVRVKDGKAARWVANWLGGAEGFETSNSALNGGSGLLKASGVPSEGMLTMATLEGDGFSLIYDGKSGVAEDMLSALSGEFTVNARKSNDVLGLVGIELAEGADLGPAQGVVEFERREGAYVFKPRDMIFAGSRLAGSIAVSRQKGDGNRLEAELTTDTADLPGILSAILARPQEGSAPEDTDPGQPPAAGSLAGAAQSAEAVIADAAIFADQSFDLSPLVELSGRLNIKAQRLTLHEDMHLSDAGLTVAFGGSRVELALSEGKALGGAASGNLSIERAPAGVIANGSIAIKGAKLDELKNAAPGSGGAPLASGEADLNATFSGRGLGPRGLVSALNGKGEVALRNVTVHGFDPGMVSGATLALVASDEPIKNFAEALRQDLGKGGLPVGSRKVGLTITDGAIRVSPIAVKTPKGVTEAVTTIDVASMAVDSEWRITAKSAVAGEAEWPPVSVTFVGPLAEIPGLEPRVNADGVERELTVRRMERNVNELERLRRLDEEAAARERERQRRIEEERARAAAEAAAAAAAAAARNQQFQYPYQQPQSAPGGGAGGAVTSEPLPPVQGAPGGGGNPWQATPSPTQGTGQAPNQPGVAINAETPEAAPQGPPPAPKPAKPPRPQLSPAELMIQQLFGGN